MSNDLPQFTLIAGTLLDACWRARRAERTPTYLTMDGDGSHVGTTPTKFEFVPSTRFPQHFFHIRCCLNNKFLRKETENSPTLVAEADEPNENFDNWASTLFERSGNIHVSIHLFFNNGHMMVNINNADKRLEVLDTPRSTNFKFVPWETLVLLPRSVVFKGDNARYLQRLPNQNRFEFAATDPAHPSAAHTIHQRFDGMINISNNHTGEFFRHVGSNIEGTTTLSQAINFEPVKVGGNVIALRFQNRFFYVQRSSDGNQLVAHADGSTTGIIKEVKLIMEERVFSREISNVVYRTSDAIVHDIENIMVATGQVFNSSDAPNSVDMRLAYSLQTTSTWNARIEAELGYRAKVSAGIPFLKIFRLEAEFEVSASISGEYEWGETVEETTEVETSYAVEVPPRSTMTISVTAFKATSDIPFSYTQRDTTFEGRVVTTRMEDGLYIGANCYDFQYEAIPSPMEEGRSLPSSSALTMKSSNALRKSPKGAPWTKE